MGETGLIVANSIKVLTQDGECQIDLCLGDITKLETENKVDVICVSAFRSDYSPTPTSVIGALKRNLGISVHHLAKNKHEDLRNLYSCWWSQPLPGDLPYKRLLCFETRSFGNTAGRPQELVANVFRCLVPILNNEDGTVITPLLNTGDQGFSEVSMLKGMVEAGVKWMKAGLPLRLLKLVLYARVKDGDLETQSHRRFKGVLKRFADLKERYEMQLLLPKAVPLEYDVYLSFSEEDEGVATVIREKLIGAKDDVRIYDSSHQGMDKESVFQEDMYSIMMKSARVITVLSPNYLNNKACIEQYNIALCCNRRAHRDMLAPIYVDSVEMMPTYMGLVQYVDCRPHDPVKIEEACIQLTATLTISFHTELIVAESDPFRYDIFLSYSHCDTEKANFFVELLQKLAPDLKLFFDVQELKTGKSWQRALYQAIDGSRCMLALLSEPYLKSAVCQEEFSLAQAKHYAKGKQHLQLIPICLEDLDTIQPEFTYIPMVKGTPDVFDDVVKTICPAVIQWLKGARMDQIKSLGTLFDDQNIPTLSADLEMEEFRQTSFHKEFGTKFGFPPQLENVLIEPEKDKEEKAEVPKTASDCNIIFSYHHDDQKYVSFMTKVLRLKAPSLKVKAASSDDHDQLSSLERSDCIIPILSPTYLESPECVEEFHIAIWRQRVANPEAPLLLPICIHTLPQKPTYFHLVQSAVSTTDGLWARLSGHHGLPQDVVDISLGVAKMQLSQADMLALYMAVYHILHRFAKARLFQEQELQPKPALFNMMKLKAEIKQITQPDYTDDICKTMLEVDVNDIPDSWRKEGHYLRPTSPRAPEDTIQTVPSPTCEGETTNASDIIKEDQCTSSDEVSGDQKTAEPSSEDSASAITPTNEANNAETPHALNEGSHDPISSDLGVIEEAKGQCASSEDVSHDKKNPESSSEDSASAITPTTDAQSQDTLKKEIHDPISSDLVVIKDATDQCISSEEVSQDQESHKSSAEVTSPAVAPGTGGARDTWMEETHDPSPAVTAFAGEATDAQTQDELNGETCDPTADQSVIKVEEPYTPSEQLGHDKSTLKKMEQDSNVLEADLQNTQGTKAPGADEMKGNQGDRGGDGRARGKEEREKEVTEPSRFSSCVLL